MIVNNGRFYYPAANGFMNFIRMPMNINPNNSDNRYYNNPLSEKRPVYQLNSPNICSYKLYDIDQNYRTESIRFVFSFIGISFKERLLKQEKLHKITEKMSLEQLPILCVNNRFDIFNRQAILRYLAREFNLYGANKYDNAIVDMVIETTCKLQDAIFHNSHNSKNEKHQTKRQRIEDNSSTYLKDLETFCDLFYRCGPYYLGSYISLADLIVYNTMNTLIEIDSKLLDNYIHLKKLYRNLKKNPRVIGYNKTSKAKSYNQYAVQSQTSSKYEKISENEQKPKKKYHRHQSNSNKRVQISERENQKSKTQQFSTKDKQLGSSPKSNFIPPPPPILTEKQS